MLHFSRNTPLISCGTIYQITDFEISLKPFDHKESVKSIAIFEKEISRKLRPELKRQIIDQSSGYPWLLKKFCIHLHENIQDGIAQVELSDNAKSLFENDLQKISGPEYICLRFIAKNAPADWFEILETYGQDVVKALLEKRLIVRSGDRINVYWDIFREYLLTGEIPSVTLNYIPASPSVRTMLDVARRLHHQEFQSVVSLGKAANISEKTVGNIVRDLSIFGVANVKQSQVTLSASIPNSDVSSILQKLRHTLKRHAFTLKLFEKDDSYLISTAEIIDILKAIKPAAQHNSKTWEIYAERVTQWLTVTGYLSARDGSCFVHDQGNIVLSFANRPRGSRKGEFDLFKAETSPLQAVNTLEMLIDKEMLPLKEYNSTTHRNAIIVLRQLGLIKTENKMLVPTFSEKIDPTELVWNAACKQETIAIAIEFLRKRPSVSGTEVGQRISEHYQKEWTPATKMRYGNAVAQWASWLLKGNDSGYISSPLGRKAEQNLIEKQSSLFEEA